MDARRCRYCRCYFRPDRRNRLHQQCCGRAACRRAAARLRQARYRRELTGAARQAYRQREAKRQQVRRAAQRETQRTAWRTAPSAAPLGSCVGGTAVPADVAPTLPALWGLLWQFAGRTDVRDVQELFARCVVDGQRLLLARSGVLAAAGPVPTNAP